MPRSGGAIAAGHPETVRVGAEMLAAGGNAVDACVAAGIASWIAEPTVAGPGGGGFMLVHDSRRQGAVAYDFFTSVPGLDATGRPIAPLEELQVDPPGGGPSRECLELRLLKPRERLPNSPIPVDEDERGNALEAE